MGYFSGSKLLFIGQNPGQPHSYKDGHADSHQQVKCDFETVQKNYYEGLIRCRMGKYIGEILKKLGLTFKDISFTNIVKYSTVNNTIPSDHNSVIMKRILDGQIKLIMPEKIVALGSYASCALTNMKHPHVHLKHPAVHNYSLKKVDENVTSIKRFKP